MTTIDALQLKDFFVEAGLDNEKAEKMAKGVRSVIQDSDLASKNDIKELELKVLRGQWSIFAAITVLMTLFEIFGS